jgi:hypothetical protein
MATWLQNVPVYGAFLVAWGGFVAIAFFVIPSRWRKRQLWYRLPAAVAVLSLALGTPILFDSAVGDHSAWHMFYMYFNLPAVVLLFTLSNLLRMDVLTTSDWKSGAVFVGASTFCWILISSAVGLLIDWTRRRRKLGGLPL